MAHLDKNVFSDLAYPNGFAWDIDMNLILISAYAPTAKKNHLVILNGMDLSIHSAREVGYIEYLGSFYVSSGQIFMTGQKESPSKFFMFKPTYELGLTETN